MVGIGEADGAGFAVGGATVVEEVELFQEKGFKAAFGGVVGGGAAHDASSDDNHVELWIGLHKSHTHSQTLSLSLITRCDGASIV